MKQSVYFIPGMSANSKIFERIHLNPEFYEITLLEWLIPYANEPFESYIDRFEKLVIKPNPIIIGVSFGGVIAQELGKRIDCKQIVVISSIVSHSELSPSLRFIKKWKMYRLFPSRRIEFLLKAAKFFPKNSTLGKKIKMYNVYLTNRDPNYLDWSMRMILNWKNDSILPNLIRIHGTKDHIFPIQYIKKPVEIIEGGTHAMILARGHEISKILEKKLYIYEKYE